MAGKFDAISKAVPNKVGELLDCEPITSLISNAGSKTVQTFIEAELIKLAGNVNVNTALNLKDYQVPMIAEMLIENYKWESIEDITLCLRRGACGYYGELFRLDAAVIGNWLAKYLDEKYDALEQRKTKEKKETKADDFYKLTKEGEAKYGKGSEFYKEAEEIANKLIGKPAKPDNNADENAFQREKMAYIPPDESYVNAKKKHIEYVRANYDPYTGNKLEHWMPEDQWIELNK